MPDSVPSPAWSILRFKPSIWACVMRMASSNFPHSASTAETGTVRATGTINPRRMTWASARATPDDTPIPRQRSSTHGGSSAMGKT